MKSPPPPLRRPLKWLPRFRRRRRNAPSPSCSPSSPPNQLPLLQLRPPIAPSPPCSPSSPPNQLPLFQLRSPIAPSPPCSPSSPPNQLPLFHLRPPIAPSPPLNQLPFFDSDRRLCPRRPVRPLRRRLMDLDLGTTFLLQNPDNAVIANKLCVGFREKLVDTVVLIKFDYSTFDEELHRFVSNEVTCGGVVIDAHGRVLTCGCAISGSPEHISHLRMKFENESDFREASVVYKDSIDGYTDCMAILVPFERRVTSEGEYRRECFALFANDRDISLGVQALVIYHSATLAFSFARGLISYTCDISENSGEADKGTLRCRTVADCYSTDEHLNRELDNFAPHTKLIQTNNTHLSNDSVGCPIFNSQGLVMGLFLFTSCEYDFFLHASYLAAFVNKTMRLLLWDRD